MASEDILYSPELALQNLADRLAHTERDNAILRAAVAYYQGALAEAQELGPTPQPPLIGSP